jgi:hypothetical protein
MGVARMPYYALRSPPTTLRARKASLELRRVKASLALRRALPPPVTERIEIAIVHDVFFDRRRPPPFIIGPTHRSRSSVPTHRPGSFLLAIAFAIGFAIDHAHGGLRRAEPLHNSHGMAHGGGLRRAEPLHNL